MREMLAVLILASSTVGCLTHENRHTFYLEPDGAATWTVLEEEIRSAEDDPDLRDREERDYLDLARRGEQGVALALRDLDPQWVATRVLRDQRPFSVVTEARFESSARMLETFLRRLGLEASAELRLDPGRVRLSFGFDRELEESEDGEDGEQWVANLVEETERYRFVLTEGEFVEAEGFRLEAGDTAAVMLDPDEIDTDGAGRWVFYSLVWSVPE